LPTTSQANLKDLLSKLASNIDTLKLTADAISNAKIRASVTKLLAASLSKAEGAAKKAQPAQRRSSGSPPASTKGQAPPAGWQSDRDALIQFLLDTQTLLTFLVQHRIPSGQRQRFSDCLPDTDKAVTASVASLKAIDSESHTIYKTLSESGLTRSSLSLKLNELRDAYTSGPALTALRIARRILGSLGKLNPLIDLLREFLETIEERLKRSPDDEILKLDIFKQVPA
jgi:hypothetical protein